MASSPPGISKASSSHKSRGELLQEMAQLEWRAAKLNQRSTLLQSALDAMHDGLAVFDANLQLVGWNRRFLELVGLPVKTVEAGLSALDLARHYSRRGFYGDVNPETHAREKFETLSGANRPQRDRLKYPDGRTVEIRRSNLADGGYLSVYSDVTDTTRIQRALAEKTAYEQSFQQCMNLWEDCPEVRPLTFHPRLGEAAARLAGVPALRVWHDQALYKEPGGRETDAHLDQAYWPIRETDTITAWIPFDGSKLESGAMGYLPGSL